MSIMLHAPTASLLTSRRHSCHSQHPHAAGRLAACQTPLVRRRCCVPPVYTAAAGIEVEAAELMNELEDDAGDEASFEDEDDGVGLTTHQVESFLQTLCEETEIAELELKMGSFSMRVRRSLEGVGGGGGGGMASPAMAASPPASPVATQSLDMAQFQPLSPTATQSTTSSYEEEDESESLVMIESPKVGVLRRGKYVKGKRIGKGDLVQEGDSIKKGQHVGYVEQLGTFVPIESKQAGEIVQFVVEDGKPVEYGEVVVELAPFFGGHIIGDKKYA